eukprot:CAMPEP_0172524876 /NCGR_PEP_ID=MMETSP1066-20121228/294421_1 /TAXON_ID=671091 /ORGANISM="Coscinodiscus wailesii, Strain CCMP2513" /LENGTH=159 /DNA_ID=CAMNT_0013308031 /DNA_START=980 /DNA_END=1459 /DNA_ORIENTATION=-
MTSHNIEDSRTTDHAERKCPSDAENIIDVSNKESTGDDDDDDDDMEDLTNIEIPLARTPAIGSNNDTLMSISVSRNVDDYAIIRCFSLSVDAFNDGANLNEFLPRQEGEKEWTPRELSLPSWAVDPLYCHDVRAKRSLEEVTMLSEGGSVAHLNKKDKK